MRIQRTTREKIADKIRADVLSRKLPEGTCLREEALAERFGVSRVPVRDALLQLTQEGWLVARPNYGVRVAELPDPSLQPLVIELRRQIETFAVNRMFQRFEKLDRDALKKVIAELKSACELGEPGGVVHCDMAFHRFILDASDCRDLLPLWLPIISRMMLHYTRHSNWMESYREHAAIAKAILAGDQKKTLKLLMSNIS